MHSPLNAEDLAWLQRFGVIKPGLRLEGDWLLAEDGTRGHNDLLHAAHFDAVCQQLLGPRLLGGVFMTGGFFLGPNDFYERLRSMPPQELAKIDMTRIDFINQLYGKHPGERDLKRAVLEPLNVHSHYGLHDRQVP